MAWLSLDQRDNDPVLFWTYLVAALKRAQGAGTDALSLLEPPQPPNEAGLVTGRPSSEPMIRKPSRRRSATSVVTWV